MKEKKVIDIGHIGDDSLQGDLPFFEKGDDDKTEEAPPFDDDKPPFMEESPFDDDKPPFMEDELPKEAQPSNPEVEEKLTSLEGRLSQLDSTLANVRKIDEETEDKINKIERSLEEMLHLYELVTNEMNPFVELPSKEAPPQEKAMSQPQPKAAEETPEPLVNVPRSIIEEDVKFSGTELHLEKISNEPTFVMLMLKWLEFLVKKAGYMGMIKALLYYEELGWISEPVRSRLIKYAEEIKAEAGQYGKHTLSIKDHVVSLFFISKLQGIKISPRVYSSVLEELDELGLPE